MLLDPRRPRLGRVSGDLVQASHSSLRLKSAQNSRGKSAPHLMISCTGRRSAIRSGSAGLDFQKGSLRYRLPVVFHTVQGCRPAPDSKVRACCCSSSTLFRASAPGLAPPVGCTNSLVRKRTLATHRQPIPAHGDYRFHRGSAPWAGQGLGTLSSG
jgi:hypothetical protein